MYSEPAHEILVLIAYAFVCFNGVQVDWVGFFLVSIDFMIWRVSVDMMVLGISVDLVNCQSELLQPIPRNSVESDLGCTSRIYFDNVTLTLYSVTLTSQKPCKHNNKCD